MSNINLTRNHQTAVFVRRSVTDTPKQVERIKALVASLNRKPNVVEGGTIKADIYTVIGQTVTPGLIDPAPAAPPVASFSLKAAASDAGFDLVAKPVKNPEDDGRVSSPRLREAADQAGYAINLIVDTATV